MALRSAESSYTEFCIKLTHHGEQTGRLTGGIQLPKSDGKQTEKLYGECTVCFCTAEPVQNCAIALSSPSIEYQDYVSLFQISSKSEMTQELVKANQEIIPKCKIF